MTDTETNDRLTCLQYMTAECLSLMGQLYNMPSLKAQEISWEMAVYLKSEVVDDYQKAAFSGYSRAAACVNPHQF